MRDSMLCANKVSNWLPYSLVLSLSLYPALASLILRHYRTYEQGNKTKKLLPVPQPVFYQLMEAGGLSSGYRAHGTADVLVTGGSGQACVFQTGTPAALRFALAPSGYALSFPYAYSTGVSLLFPLGTKHVFSKSLWAI